MAWMYLLLAGLTEVVWALGLKYSEGFTHIPISIVTVVFMIVSFFLFAQALKKIPIGTAYAIFTGIGAAGTAIIGILFLNESRDWFKLLSLTLLIGGLVGLKLSETETDDEHVDRTTSKNEVNV